MDALTLVMPAAPIANSGSTGTDIPALGAREDGASAGFAALLAAGLLQQQDAAALAGMPNANAQAPEQASEDEASALVADVGGAAMPAPALPFHPAVAVPLQSAGSDAERAAASAAALTAATSNAEDLYEDATPIAASAATIAGDAAEEALHPLRENESARFDAPAAAETQAPGADGAATHPLHLGASERAQPTQPTAVLEVAAPVRSPDFAQSLSQQVVWMADKDAQVAELRINPPELGPVEVRLQLAGDEASVQFASAHAEVRSAIESAIARLRESMAQAGIQLGEASVSAESFRDQAAHDFGSGEGRRGYRAGREHAEPGWTPTPIAESVRRGLVDLFA